MKREKKREQFALAHAIVPCVMDCLEGMAEDEDSGSWAHGL